MLGAPTRPHPRRLTPAVRACTAWAALWFGAGVASMTAIMMATGGAVFVPGLLAVVTVVALGATGAAALVTGLIKQARRSPRVITAANALAALLAVVIGGWLVVETRMVSGPPDWLEAAGFEAIWLCATVTLHTAATLLLGPDTPPRHEAEMQQLEE